MTRRHVASGVVGLAVTLASGWWLVTRVDLGPVAGALGRLEIAWLAPAFVVLAIQAAVRATRWSLVLGAGGFRVPPMRLVGPMLVGYLVNAILPARLGEAARAGIAAIRERVPVGAVAGTVVVERAADLAALLVLAAFVAALGGGGAISMGIGAAAVLTLAVLFAARYAEVILRLIPSRAPERLRGLARDLAATVGRMPRRSLIAVFGVSVVAWLGDAALAWIVGRALGLELSPAGAAAIGLGAALGTALPAAPGYIATYELGAVTLGSLAGVAASEALAVALLLHIVAVAGLALAGAVSAGLLGREMSMRAAVRARALPILGPGSPAGEARPR